MGRNAAFGRPSASERLLTWWDARSTAARQNVVLAAVVGALFVAIVMAALARHQVPSTPRVIASRPQPTTTLALPTPSTVDIGDLGGSVSAAELFGLNTTSTNPAPATSAPPPATTPTSTRAAAPATTTPPGPATTVTNPDVIYTTVAPDPTTTRPPTTTTTKPPATTTTTPATTSTTTGLPPLTVPGLLTP